MTAPAPTTPPASADELFAEIHRDHLGIVMKVTHGFVASPADRDDLFQEILIALWQALPKFSAQARLSTNVYRVALSCALNWKRSQKRYGRKLDDYTLALPALTAAPGPEQERLRWLYACIHELRPAGLGLALLSIFMNQPPSEVGWTPLLLRAASVLAFVLVAGAVCWRHYRKNLEPEHARRKQVLAELS